MGLEMRMALGAPWLRARGLAVLRICLDGVASWVSCGVVSVWQMGEFGAAGLTPVKIWVCWCIYSYLAGCYSEEGQERENRRSERWQTSAYVAIVTLMTVVAEGWWTGNYLGTGLRSYLMPVISGTYALSNVKELLLRKKEKTYIVLCSREFKEYIEYEVSRRPKASKEVRVVELDSEDNVRGISDWEKSSSTVFVVEDRLLGDKRYSGFLEALLRSGWSVVGLEEWIEREFQVIHIALMDDRWFYTSSGFSLRPGRFYWRLKRLTDILASIFIMLCVAPIICLAAIAVKIEDGGSVLYYQKRTGMYGREIWIAKIRSMIEEAEPNGAQWAAIQGDKRITRVGWILRKTRIDELPQLWSVIKGELSLIGPRPERPEIEENLVKYLVGYQYRHWVRPGLSGWAQVNFRYGSSVEDSRIKLGYDVYYLKNASVWLDVLIAVKTIRTILYGSGT